jgi:hypothetical protein
LPYREGPPATQCTGPRLRGDDACGERARNHGVPQPGEGGIEALGSLFTGKEYEPKIADERKLMRKLKTLEPLGAPGCYLPAVLG